MIYITDSKSNGDPCEKVYQGNKYSWYYCKDKSSLFASFINLLKNNTANFKIINPYGKSILIPNNPSDFEIVDTIEEFVGIINDIKNINYLIQISKSIKIKNKFVKARLKTKINAEEILRLGIRIYKPIILPRIYSNSLSKNLNIIKEKL
jgi:hypothetical protein